LSPPGNHDSWKFSGTDAALDVGATEELVGAAAAIATARVRFITVHSVMPLSVLRAAVPR
jgi:hypothetical protein